MLLRIYHVLVHGYGAATLISQNGEIDDEAISMTLLKQLYPVDFCSLSSR